MTEAIHPFVSMRDLLGKVAELHASCRNRLAVAATTTGDLRRRVLLSFLETHEREQLQAITRLCRTDERVLDCFVQSVPAAAFAEACGWELVFGSCDEMLESYLCREQSIERCFRQVMDGVGPKAMGLLASLIRMKQQHQARLREASLDF